MNLAKRFGLNLSIFIVISIVISVYYNLVSQTLTDITIITGWILFALMVFLAAYNIRKKLTFLPLGNSSTWLQFHIYAGYLSSLLLLLHTGFKVPNGQLEVTLTILYLVVFISGIIGLIMTRTFPKRLSSRSGEYIFERIPFYRIVIREQANSLAVSSIKETRSSVIAEFHRDEIVPFLSQPKYLFHHFWESRRPLIQLQRKIDNVAIYMNDKEKVYMDEIRELIQQKYDLDYSLCLQGCLKFWLFIHIPFTYCLMIFSILHIILVYAFTGGMS